MLIRYLYRHRKGCLALDNVAKGRRTTPWRLPDTGIRRYDASGTWHDDFRRNTHVWVVMYCNDPKCQAEKRVRHDAIEMLGEEGRDD